MANIGSYGVARAQADVAAEEYDSFVFFGREFRIANDSGGAVMFDYAEAVTSELDIKDAQQAAAIKAMVKDLVLPADWPSFWAHYKAQRGDAQYLIEQFAELSVVLYQHVAGRPTDRPSGSAGGSSSTGSGTAPTASNGLPSGPQQPVAAPPTLVAVADGSGGFVTSPQQ